MDIYSIAFVILIILGVVGMGFGYLKGISKSFQNNQPNAAIQTSSLKDQEKKQASDAEEQRRAYMDDIRQKIRDNQRR